MLFVICTGVAIGYAWFAVRAYRAERLFQNSDLNSLEKAINLAPRNAEYHEQLCRTMIFVSQRPDSAVPQCREASELDPYNSAIWLDLATAYYSIGNNASTNASLHRALAVDPTTPDTVWNVANLLLIEGNTDEALKEFATLLREYPPFAPASLSACWQSLHDANRIKHILPLNSDIYLAFIRIVLSTGDANAARQIWAALIQSKAPLDLHQGLFYVDSLIQLRSVSEASDAWERLLSRSGVLQAYSEPGNLITNGTFAQEILNSGFDWRYVAQPQIAVSLDKAESHVGNRSLRLEYSGSGSDAGISQYVAVQPNMLYRLSAWVKSDDLKTANGPIIAIYDDYNNATFSATEETVGTTLWHRVETEVQTGPETKLLVLVVLRRPGETRIQGTFWVDDIKLEAVKQL